MENVETVVVPSATSLARATVLSAVVASVLLVTVILPAEYGVDPTGAGRALGLYRPRASDAVPADAAALAETTPMASSGTTLTRSPVPYRTDEMSLTLKPGEGGEIKAVMAKGQHFVYTWTAVGGTVDVDMHGEALDATDAAEATSYWKDEYQASDQGIFTAPVAGRHGWFWQNLNDDPVTITVRTSGFYQGLVRP
jgi:hypothetical protein